MSKIKFHSKNMPKGFVTSTIVHALLLLFAFFYTYSAEMPKLQDPLEQTFELDVDIPEVRVKRKIAKVEPKIVDLEKDAETSNSTKADADKGESRPQNNEVQKVKVNDPRPPEAKVESRPVTPAPVVTPPAPAAKPSVPAPSTPTPSVKPSTQAPITVKESETKVSAPDRDPTPTKTTTSTSGPAPSRPSGGPVASTPTRSTNNGAGTVGSPTGTGSKPQSNTDGDGRGKSTSGTGLGSGVGSDVTSGTGNSSDGTGEFDGNGNSDIFGRALIKRNTKNLPVSIEGTFVLKVCVNRSGNVTFTEIMPGTTIGDKSVLKQCMVAAKGYVWAASANAAAEQCGKLTIIFKKSKTLNSKQQ
jgi:outer membrane biosynthesis protein TonB